MPTTQLALGGYGTQRYGSFSGRTSGTVQYLEEARKAIEAEISDGWSATPIAWPNRPFSTVSVTAYIRPIIIWGRAVRLTIGSGGINRVTGLLSVDIFTQRGTGRGTALGYVDDVRDLFNRVTIAGIPDVRFKAPTGAVPFPATGEAWGMVNVAMPFELDEITP